jgi:hypothetical protein
MLSSSWVFQLKLCTHLASLPSMLRATPISSVYINLYWTLTYNVRDMRHVRGWLLRGGGSWWWLRHRSEVGEVSTLQLWWHTKRLPIPPLLNTQLHVCKPLTLWCNLTWILTGRNCIRRLGLNITQKPVNNRTTRWEHNSYRMHCQPQTLGWDKGFGMKWQGKIRLAPLLAP